MSGRPFFLSNLILFVRLFRKAGMEVTTTQTLDLLRALELISIGRRDDFKASLQCIFVHSHSQLERFNAVFDAFWSALQDSEPTEHELGRILQKSAVQEVAVQTTATSDSLQDPAAESSQLMGLPSYSAHEQLRRKDFARLTEEELLEVKELMDRLRWDLEKRRRRRRVRSSRGALLDMRQTLRHNLRAGAELVRLKRQGRGERNLKLVVLCDISGSMEPYARLLLRFIYGLSSGLAKVEAFSFGTRLTRLTQRLRESNIDAALQATIDSIRDWGGGTRIGESLREFNFLWTRRVSGQGAIVLLISDGWDRGEAELLGRQMERLQRSCRKLIWLNPLLGSPGYEPLSSGVTAALPYVDHFMPVHNLVSLEQLGNMLAMCK